MDSKSRPMLWSPKHDELLCREIFTVNPFAVTKKRTVRQGAKWGMIAENLNKIQEAYFKVDKRAVRDRYNLFTKDLRDKPRKELSVSGIETKLSDVETALEEIIDTEDSAETEQQYIRKREKENKDRQDAEKMRKKAMETLGQSQKTSLDDADKTPINKRRSNGSDAVNYLKEKTNVLTQWGKEELELKRRQLYAESKRHQDFMQAMLLQQQVEQQQMKQKNDIMMALLCHIVQKKQ